MQWFRRVIFALLALAGEGIDSPQSRTSWYTEFDKRKMSALIQSRI